MRAPDTHIVVGPGDLVATAQDSSKHARLWHYRIDQPAAACSVALAAGPWHTHAVPEVQPETRAAVAGVINPSDDAGGGGSGADAAAPLGGGAAVTGFARTALRESGLLESTMEAAGLVQCILEQCAALCVARGPRQLCVCAARAVAGAWRNSMSFLCGTSAVETCRICPKVSSSF